MNNGDPNLRTRFDPIARYSVAVFVQAFDKRVFAVDRVQEEPSSGAAEHECDEDHGRVSSNHPHIANDGADKPTNSTIRICRSKSLQ